MTNLATLGVTVVGAVAVGSTFAWGAVAWLHNRVQSYAQARAKAIAAQGREARETLQARAAAALSERRQALDAQRIAAATAHQRHLDALQAEVAEAETALQAQEKAQQARAQAVDTQAKELTCKLNAWRQSRDAQPQLVAQRQQAYAQRAEVTVPEALAQLQHQHAERATLLAHSQRLRTCEQAQSTAPREAKRLLGVASERYDGVGHLERIQNTHSFAAQPALAVFADPNAYCVNLLHTVGHCDYVCDPVKRTITVRGDDPMGRELGRRLLRILLTRPDLEPNRLRARVIELKTDLDREAQMAGRKAQRLFAMGRMHPDVLNLVGRLTFRLSYSQNQWKHAVEVAHLCGMLADEMHLNVAQAQRGGLLHDIGKAMTHEREGSHAVLGAAVARQCGEEEAIANAIGAHHNDEPAQGPLAHIVAAADAISGARPGARRASARQYLTYIEDLQKLMERYPEVDRIEVMNAGREVRVIVPGLTGDAQAQTAQRPTDPTQAADATLYPLAQKIARDVEDELVYAGQIRVTVIRETRAWAVAG